MTASLKACVYRVRPKGIKGPNTEWLRTDGWCGFDEEPIANFPLPQLARIGADTAKKKSQEGLGAHREVVEVSWGLKYTTSDERPYYAGENRGDEPKDGFDDWSNSAGKAMRFASARAAYKFRREQLGFLKPDLRVVRFVKVMKGI